MNLFRARATAVLLSTACAAFAAGDTIDGGTTATGTTAESGTDDGEGATVASQSNRTTANRPSPTPARPAADGTLAGKTIHLDPGHAAAMPEPNPMITDGRGGVKPCQVPGTAANDGWPEHTFNWLMAGAIRERLEERGATVTLSRNDDAGVADCIDVRALKENESDADLVVSLHADGSEEGNRGFHVIAIADPLPANDVDGSMALAGAIRDAFVDAGFAPSNYLGTDGIDLRSDLTGLNLSSKPKVLMEFGNMRDPADIAVLASDDGRARMADAVVDGIMRTIEGES